MPAELAGVIWQAVSTPLGAPYMPLYNALTEVPPSYARGANVFSPGSAYWAFHGAHALQRLLDRLDPTPGPGWWCAFEAQCLDEAPLLAAMLGDAHRKSPTTAVDLARRLSAGVATQAVDLARRTTAALMTDAANRSAEQHTRAIASPAPA
jgi:dipeptidase